MCYGKKRRNRELLVWGIVLIGLGMVFLLMGMDVLPHGALRTWWPLFVVITGLGSLFAASDSRTLGSAVTTIGLGGWLLVAANGWYGLGWRRSWPLAFVAIGIGTVVDALASRWWRGNVERKEDGHVA